MTILVVDDYGADVAALGFGAAYIEALVCSIGAGVGFMLAMVMFSGVRKRVEACDPPEPFKGKKPLDEAYKEWKEQLLSEHLPGKSPNPEGDTTNWEKSFETGKREV